jgi:ankyrin repeat protein
LVETVNEQAGWLGLTALHSAAEYGDVSAAHWLLENKANVVNSRYSGTPLNIAASAGHLDIVKLLVRKSNVSVNVKNASGMTAFHSAAECGYLGIVECLFCETNIGVNRSSGLNAQWTALHYAAHRGHFNVVNWLIHNGAALDQEDAHGCTALYYATTARHLEIVKSLVEAGNVIVHSDGLTVLDLAAREVGDSSIVKWLVDEKGMEIDARVDGEQTTILRYTPVRRPWDLNLIRWLVEQRNLDPNEKDSRGRTALHQATIDGRLDQVVALMNTGEMDVNAKDQLGWTALHYAAQLFRLDIVLELVAVWNADLQARDWNGRTVYEVAKYDLTPWVCHGGVTEAGTLATVDSASLCLLNYD